MLGSFAGMPASSKESFESARTVYVEQASDIAADF
jgi:hypothetical protein